MIGTEIPTQTAKKRIEEYRAKLEEAMLSLSSNTQLIISINNDMSLAYQGEEEFWKQRSRQIWLALDDKNTSYFHAASKGRKAINSVFVIEDDENLAYYEDQILQVISNYFTSLFTSEVGERFTTVSEALQSCMTETLNTSLITAPRLE